MTCDIAQANVGYTAKSNLLITIRHTSKAYRLICVPATDAKKEDRGYS